MNKALTKTDAIPAKITSAMLYQEAGANRLPAQVVFEQSVYDGTAQHADNPIEAIEGFTKAVYSEFEWTERTEMYPGFTVDELAVSLNTVMRRLDGFTTRTVKRSALDKPATRRVPVGFNMKSGDMDYVVVPSGATSLPFRKTGDTFPWICVGIQPSSGVPYIQANVLRGDQSHLEGLFSFVRKWSEQNSIYLGQAVDTNFNFIDRTKFDPTKVALTRKMQIALDCYVRGPLMYRDTLDAMRQDPKTALLMQGPPGGGKTMNVTLCEFQVIVAGGVVIHVDPSRGIDGLDRANIMATRLMDAGHMVMIAFEDMENLAGQSRAKMLEILDGASSKTQRRIIVGTTNFVERIDRAALRHGRFDDVLYCGLPDKQAFEQVIRVVFEPKHLGDLDFDFMFPYFEGYSYATINNAASKVIRLAVNRLEGDMSNFKVETQDLVDAAEMVRDQHNLVNEEVSKELPVFDQLLRDILEETVTTEIRDYIYENVPFGDCTDYSEVQERAQEGADQAIEYRLNEARISDGKLHTN